MSSSDTYAKECKETAVSLEKTANGLSFTYSVCIWLAIISNIILIGNYIKKSQINIIIGGVSLLLTLVPLILKNKIEKIEGYINLSIDFKNLEQDFRQGNHESKNQNRLKELRKSLSKYPIYKSVKWLP